jgi:N-acylneuraminate cytidylyltransferase
MKAIAIIPARGGSKSLPGKNIKLLGGRPLIAWSIEAAMPSRYVSRIVVTTDSDEIGKIAEHFGAEFLRRPDHLATDKCSLDRVLTHAIKETRALRNLEELVVTLQPTVPLRGPDLIDDCIERLIETDADSLLTVHEGPHFAWQKFGDKAIALNIPVSKRVMRQDITEQDRVYLENGACYVTKTGLLLKAQNRLCGRITPFEIPEENGIDIDTDYDFWLTEKRMQYELMNGIRQKPWAMGA